MIAALQDPVTGREFVLIAGGAWSGSLKHAVLYDATRRVALPLPPPIHGRTGAAACAFPGGVLITGGEDENGDELDEVEIFLLGTRQFHSWGRLNRGRRNHTVVALDATRFLVIGGRSKGQVLGDIELFDAATATSVTLPFGLHLPRENFEAVLRPDGSVLVAGGEDPAGFHPSRTPELLTATGSIPLRPLGAQYHKVTAQALPGGRMIVFGLQTTHHFP